MSHFDSQAAAWDTPFRVERAQRFAQLIRDALPIAEDEAILEVGCATGQVGRALLPKNGKLLGLETSAAMVQQMQESCAHDPRISCRCHDLCTGPIQGSYSLAVACMVFHHVADLARLLQHLRLSLRPHARLAIIDLQEEDGSFHPPESPVPHHGFSQAKLERLLSDNGFTPLIWTAVEAAEKPSAEPDRPPRQYPRFLLTAQRNI